MQMAASHKVFFHLMMAIVLFSSPYFCSCFWASSFNHTVDAFRNAIATFYDDPGVFGSGGACGFENDVEKPPFSGKITAGNQVLFRHGKGCNICYSVKCTENPECSGNPIKVTLTDECPGTCNNDPVHFDLSAIAFGQLAKPGRADRLRKAGRIKVEYQRAACNYPGNSIVFKVDKGSNPFFFAAAIEYQNGEGDLSKVEIQPAASKQWSSMQQLFGATYKYDVPSGTKGPYSIRLTTMKKRTLVAQNVIPANWKPRGYYKSNVNFMPTPPWYRFMYWKRQQELEE